MQVLGVTLIAATLVIPAVVARMLTNSFSRMLWLSTVIGAVCGFVGMNLSYHLDVQSGPTIVLVAARRFSWWRWWSPTSGRAAPPRPGVTGSGPRDLARTTLDRTVRLVHTGCAVSACYPAIRLGLKLDRGRLPIATASASTATGTESETAPAPARRRRPTRPAPAASGPVSATSWNSGAPWLLERQLESSGSSMRPSTVTASAPVRAGCTRSGLAAVAWPPLTVTMSCRS